MFINHQQGNFQASVCSENQISISGGLVVWQPPGASLEVKFGCHLKHSGEQNLSCPAQEVSLEDGHRAGEEAEGKEEKLPGAGMQIFVLICNSLLLQILPPLLLLTGTGLFCQRTAFKYEQ